VDVVKERINAAKAINAFAVFLRHIFFTIVFITSPVLSAYCNFYYYSAIIVPVFN
jgi:hypothetical protein